MLTDLQKSRIKFHLDITYDTAYAEIQADFRLQLDNLDPNKELALVGNQSNKNYSFLGQPLCQIGSMLYRVEKAFELLSPDTIDTTLYVKETEEVKLNPNEARKRRMFYELLVSELRRYFDLPDKTLTYF